MRKDFRSESDKRIFLEYCKTIDAELRANLPTILKPPPEGGNQIAYADIADAIADEARNPWKQAIINELVVSHILHTDHETDPRKALAALVDYECKVALDPAVGKEAQALIEPYRKDAERWREYIKTLKSSVDIEGINVRVSAQRNDGSIYAIHHAIRPWEYINDEMVAERVGQRLSHEIIAAIAAAKGESE